MSETWSDYPGLAIATFPYIANGERQLSILAGDQFQVFHKNGEWIHVKNLLSGSEGIIPLSCVAYNENQGPIDSLQLFNKPNDLLIIEARMTLRYVLNILRTAEPVLTANLSEKVTTIVTILTDFDGQKVPREKILRTRKILSETLDQVRDILHLSKVTRTGNSCFNTVTTTSRDIFQHVMLRSHHRDPEYIVFHVEITCDVRKPLPIRCFILHKNQGDLSTSVSATITPTNPTVTFAFDQFERRDMKDTSYLVIYAYDEHNEVFGCAATDLPSCRQEAGFGKPHQLTINTQTSTPAYINKLHQFLTTSSSIDIVKPLQNGPIFNAKFTCYFGPSNVIFDKDCFQHAIIVPPLHLPSTFPPSLRRSVVNVCYTAMSQHSKRKNTRITTHLVDMNSKRFVKSIENPDTHVLDAELWNSSIYRGEKSMGIHDSFQVDISVANGNLNGYYIALEIQRVGHDDMHFVPSSYSLIPLADKIGAANTQIDTVPLYRLPKNSKPNDINNYKIPPEKGLTSTVGVVDFILAFSSTLVTANIPLFKLLNWKNFPNDLGQSITEFSSCGFNEWSKFIQLILAALCEIISSKEAFAYNAFQQLQMVLGEILNKSDYIPLLDHFINTELNPEEKHSTVYSCFSFHVIPEIKKAIDNNDRTSTEFRTLIKCLPYLLQISMRSYVIHHKQYNADRPFLDDDPPKGGSKEVQEDIAIMNSMKTSLTDIMAFLCNLIAEKPDMSDQQMKSKIFTNQSLTLQHFPSVIDALLKVFPPAYLVPYIIQFLQKVRYIEGDRTQQVIDKNKLRVILALSVTEIWKDPEAHDLIQGQFKTDLMTAFQYPYCADLFLQTLSSLFFSNKNEYFLQFIDPCVTLLKTNENLSELVRRFLLIIAFYFPTKFPSDLFLNLLSVARNTIPASELIFIFSHYISKSITFAGPSSSTTSTSDIAQNDAPDEPVSSNLSAERIGQLLTLFLEIAAKAGYGKEYDPLDKEIMKVIYPQNTNFNLLKVESGMQIKLVLPLIECYLIYKSPEIKEAFVGIILSDLRQNKTCNNVKKPALQGLYDMSKRENFISLLELFDIQEPAILENEEGKNFLNQFKKLVQCFQDINTIEIGIRNEDRLGEAISTIIFTAFDVENYEILPPLIEKLVTLEETCKNYLEAGEAILLALRLVKPDLTPAPTFMDVNKKFEDGLTQLGIDPLPMTGLNFHLAILTRAIDYFNQAKMEEYAMALLEEARKLCNENHFYDQLPDIAEREATIFKAISGLDRVFSNYYFVGFYGGGFDDYYRHRSFVYRRSFFVQTTAMMSEMQEKFPGAVIDKEPPTEENINSPDGMYIQILPVNPSPPEEIDDQFYRKDVDLPKYLITFGDNRAPSVFRYEKSIKDKSKKYINEFAGIFLEQYYFVTSASLPYIITRCEIDTTKTVKRQLSPLENAIICMNRKNEELKINNFVFNRVLQKLQRTGENTTDGGAMSSFAMSLNGTVNAAVNGGNTMYTEAFLSDQYKQENPQDEEQMLKLRYSFKEQVEALEKGLEIHEQLVDDSFRGLHITIVEGFKNMKESLQPIISGL